MSSHLIQQQIKELRSLINYHNYNYYVLDAPKISDFAFDNLIQKLILLENKHPEYSDSLSPTKRVGGGLIAGFKSVKHNYPMLSLSNTYSELDLRNFDLRIKRFLKVDDVAYSCELKYDGVAISLVYQDGLLKQAVTRGDGVMGDDVTENIKTIKSIPLQLFGNYPHFLEMRGEVFVKKSTFHQINQKRVDKKKEITQEYNDLMNTDISDIDKNKIEKKFNADIKKLETYSNPRNFASGSLKLLDSSRVAKRHLNCILYSVYSDTLPHRTHLENLMESEKWGFKIPKDICLVHNVPDLMSFIEKFELVRDSLPFEIDGVVVKVNRIYYQELLGNTSKSPRWAISYKFKAIQAFTKLNDVKYQVGRTGAITPVACLDPVSLAGSVIKRASLHNSDFIKKLDLKIGDSVIIEKGGDVIPKVVAVDLSKRTTLCKNIAFTKHCPECNSILIRPDEEVNYYCFNSDLCVTQKIAQVEHFISRDAMNISTLGSKTINLLFQESIINNIADLYALEINQLTHLKGFGSESNSFKKAQNIIDSIEQSKTNPFSKLLYALGIRYVGKTVSKKIINHFYSIHHLIDASKSELLQVDEVGEKIADSIITYFSNEDNRSLISRLMNYGLQFNENNERIISKKLSGLIFVISGTFEVSREYLKKIIDLNGGQYTSSLSRRTNYLVAGQNMGPKKREKALELKIPIISQIDLEKMLE